MNENIVFETEFLMQFVKESGVEISKALEKLMADIGIGEIINRARLASGNNLDDEDVIEIVANQFKKDVEEALKGNVNFEMLAHTRRSRKAMVSEKLRGKKNRAVCADEKPKKDVITYKIVIDREKVANSSKANNFQYETSSVNNYAKKFINKCDLIYEYVRKIAAYEFGRTVIVSNYERDKDTASFTVATRDDKLSRRFINEVVADIIVVSDQGFKPDVGKEIFSVGTI